MVVPVPVRGGSQHVQHPLLRKLLESETVLSNKSVVCQYADKYIA